MSSLPTGTVTFLFTDMEESTRLWEQFPDVMPQVMARHDDLIETCVEQQHGVVVRPRGEGDSRFAVFANAKDAVTAAAAIQTRLYQEDLPLPALVRVRIALHTGEADLRMGDYYGSAVNHCARLRGIANGGQTLLSGITAALLGDALPENTLLRDHGEHRLKDLSRPERVFQLIQPDLPTDSRSLKSLNAFPNNLPVQLSSFVGREREIVEVKGLLSSTRLLTLTGSGGAGKTRLAVQVAADMLASSEAGVWLAELAPLDDPSHVLQAVASVFDLRESPYLPLQGVVTEYLRTRELLLILDNCEHLIEACARLSDHLLRGCPKLKIIATSREAFGISGEVAYRVPSLSLPAPDTDTDSMALCEAVQLFVERALAVQPRFVFDLNNAPAIANICQQLDGIPLALELAAACIPVFSPEQITGRLEDRFRLLTRGNRTALPRQQTLRAMIDWSYFLLSEPERALLRQLSVFVGSWTFEAAEAVAPDLDVLQVLPRLVDKSLVIVDDGRYRFLETIRQYALEKLKEQGEADAARDRHLDYFVRYSEEAELGLRGDDCFRWVAYLDLDYDNIRAAIEWGMADRPEDALCLPGNLFIWWSRRSDVSEGTHLLRTLLQRLEMLPSASGESARRCARIRAKGYAALGTLVVPLATREQAVQTRAEMQVAVALERQYGEPFTLAYSLHLLGVSHVWLGDVQNAQAALEESILRFNAIGNDLWALFPRVPLCILFRAQNDMSAAQEHYQVLRRWVDRFDHPITMPAYQELGYLALVEGDLLTARGYFQKGLNLARRTKSKDYETMLQSDLTHVMRRLGDLNGAKASYRETIGKWKDLGHRAAVAHQLECLAFIAHAEQWLEQAARLVGAAAALREDCESPMNDAERPEYDDELAALRRALDADVFDLNWLAGRAMTIDEAIAFAVETSTPALLPEDDSIPRTIRLSPSLLIEPLSPREQEVLQLIAEGLSNSEIAQRLFLAPTTVKVHTRHIYEKLGVNSRTQAVGPGAPAEAPFGKSARIVAYKPSKYSFGTIPIVGHFVWQALFTVGQLTAAGGCGHLAVQLARWEGARVVGTASAANTDFVRSLGANLVLDFVGGAMYQRSLDAAKPGGTVVLSCSPEMISSGPRSGLWCIDGQETVRIVLVANNPQSWLNPQRIKQVDDLLDTLNLDRTELAQRVVDSWWVI